MYSTCLFCHNRLGSNDLIEQLPVGQRLAFDAAKGRLWVVCPRCTRWNLTPIEQRWEVIEDCERMYRTTRARVATDQIGLARIAERLDLIRIGKPLLPEFAAWRYGSRFRRRRRIDLAQRGALVAVTAALSPISLLALAFNAVRFSDDPLPPPTSSRWGPRGRRPLARVPAAGGQQRTLRVYQAERATLLPAANGEEWGIAVPMSAKSLLQEIRDLEEDPTVLEVRGEAAVRLVSRILPVINRRGATEATVKEAVQIVESGRDLEALFNSSAGIARRRNWSGYGSTGLIAHLPPERRLALEIASHEETERSAIEGELYLLEDAWREAEEIASIADNLFLPASVLDAFSRLKRNHAQA